VPNLSKSGPLVLAVVTVACSSGGEDPVGGRPAAESTYVRLLEDGRSCSVKAQVIPCSGLASYLERSLSLPKTSSIILSDNKVGRRGDTLLIIAEDLRRAGYSDVLRIGFVTEP
jgi:hypothetical protein